jgi:hypothetical protein
MADDEHVAPQPTNYNDWNLNLAGIPGPQGATGPASIPEAPNDGYLYGRHALGWSSGGTLSGPLTLTAQTPALALNKAAGAYANNFYGATAGVNRWLMQMGSGGPESGSNAGSDFGLYRCNDAGALIDTVLSITRAGGVAYFGGQVNVNQNNLIGDAQLVVQCPPPASGGGACRIEYNFGNVRMWKTGVASNGHFYISDETGGAVLMDMPTVNGGNIVFSSLGITTSLGISAGNSSWCYGNGFEYPSLGGGNFFAFTWDGGGTPMAILYVDGGGASYWIANGSDERLKADIAPTQYDCLAAVNQIDLWEFRWKDHHIPGEPVYDPDAPLVPCGFVAQRLHDQFPHLVQRGDSHQDRLLTRAEREERRQQRGVDAEGRDNPATPDDINLVWDIEKNNTMALLVGAVQQLTQRVQALEAQLAAR